jgi:Rrf2 family protein
METANNTVIRISEKLGISKIYLEQVFSLLKRGGIVHSVKGAQGGYQLARAPGQISVLAVLAAVELSLFEPAEETVSDKAPDIEAAMMLPAAHERLTRGEARIGQITLSDLARKPQSINRRTEQFYIEPEKYTLFYYGN